MKKLILGIETSCDETGVALVEASGGLRFPKFKVVKNLVASQVKIHEPFGGVVPNLAKREHQKNLPILFEKIGGEKAIKKIDLVAVTVGPGLEPALWTGIVFAQELAKKYKKLLVGTNHLEGHLYSFLLPQKSKSKIENRKSIFPAVALIVSGGHTMVLAMKNLETWRCLGETRDDAVGEAYDKVARLLRLPYPGGPALEKLAKRGDGSAIEFPRPMIHDKNFDFSFSGLKTSVLYYLRDHKKYSPANVVASFQKAAVEVLVKKTMKAAEEVGAKSVMLSGGVAANSFLRLSLKNEARKAGVSLLVADQKYNTDNAVMIAAAGYMASLREKKYPLRANGNLGV